MPWRGLYEKRGNFSQAIALWELVKQADPTDAEAQHKGKDLAANETIYARQVRSTSLQKPPSKTESEDTAPPTMDDATDIAPTKTASLREAAPLLARMASEPTDPLPYLQLAAVYNRAGRYDEARTPCRTAWGRPGSTSSCASN